VQCVLTKLKSQGIVVRDFLHFIALRFKQDRCGQLSASLTFTTLLSLVPLITIALTLFSAFPVFADFSSHIKTFFLSNLMPETGGRMITRYMEQFAESAAKLTTVGIVFLATTAMLMMVTIDNAFNAIWRVRTQRNIIHRVLIYWAVLTLGPLLVGGSLTLTSWLIGLSVGYAHELSSVGVVMLKVIPVILTSLAFSLLYRIVPNRYVSIRHAIIGGIIGAALFESMNRIFAFYIAHFPTYKLVYGAFASIPIFLMWIYLSWFTVLFGALITAALPHWRSKVSLKMNPTTRFYTAIEMLKAMHLGMKTSHIVELQALCSELKLGYDDAEDILFQLAKANLVGKLAGQGWAMIRDPQHTTLGELATLFLWDAHKIPAPIAHSDVANWFAKLNIQSANAQNINLVQLWQKPR
jgi:membrane protein